MRLGARRSFVVVTACFALFGVCAPAAAETGAKILLLDSSTNTLEANARLEVGQVTKAAQNPLFVEDRPWETRFDNLYPNVMWDPATESYRCWYNLFLVTIPDWLPSTDGTERWLYRQSGVCYAESRDGLRWTKPELVHYRYQGKPSNIVYPDAHGAGVFRDEREPDPSRRYKMIFRHDRKTGKVRYDVGVAFSADGLTWSEPRDVTEIKAKADTHNNALWSAHLNRYVAFTREWAFALAGDTEKTVRVVSRAESTDFVHWTGAVPVLRGLEVDRQVYAMPVFAYAGGYIGLPVIYRPSENRSHVELAWSKDTINWERVDPGTPLIPNGATPAAYDWGCIFPAAHPIDSGDSVRLYYSGSDALHSGPRKGSLALATLRRDGYAGVVPLDPAQPATVRSGAVPLARGDTLRVSADVAPGGSVVVVLLNEAGQEVDRSLPLSGGKHTSAAVAWQAAAWPEPAQLKHLRFVVTRAKLYAYEIGAQ